MTNRHRAASRAGASPSLSFKVMLGSIWLLPGLCLFGPPPAWARPGRHAGSQEQRLPRQAPSKVAALEGVVHDPSGRAVPGAKVTLRNLATGKAVEATTTGDGVFRLPDLQPGRYALEIEKQGYKTLSRSDLQVAAGEIVEADLTLEPSAPPAPLGLPRQPELGPLPPAQPPPPPPGPYEKLPQASQAPSPAAPAALPPAQDVFFPEPDRWQIPIPAWQRYPQKKGENTYARSHRWDPFNRNKLKGDYPIFGQQNFFSFTGTSDTFFDARRLPSPSDVSAARPGSSDFFGKGEQAFLEQNFRLTFDLFHGDTSFRPVDWRLRFTPVFNVNFLATRELGLVNIDVRRGKQRTDDHIGLQEGFFEYKLHDLSPYYDFVSVRAGIQEFTSDFRGFLFSDSEPGLRFFGNLDDNRWQYNAAYFYMLEKDTNSGLNTIGRRHQQVLAANVYRQDFVKPGYTAEFSIHYSKDDGSVRFDRNGFLVRPAPIGAVISCAGGTHICTHTVEAAYLGWTGDGHFGRLNITHAFYQALGQDTFNPIAGRRVTINAQMAAVELSMDKDWARFKVSAFYASGSGDPRSGHARGFDAIEDFPDFAGGIFSLWNREGIRLTGTGVLLTPPNSLLPSLRSSKDQGQANFVNPGLFLVHSGANFDLTPKLSAFVNASFLRFMRTEPLELVLFQSPIHHTIGVDYNIGASYRPPLTENIVLTGGAAALTPGQGFRDIYTGKTLFSMFLDLRMRF
jgi:Carboxypeptidase regulatory-like domain